MAEIGPLEPGDPAALGAYIPVGRLGEGGQGVVFLAHAPDGTSVAVKVLHSRLARDSAARSRFVREATAAQQVARFCTAQVLDVGVEGDRPYIVSEYVQALSLQQHVARFGPRSGAELDRLAIATVTALAAIHGAGVVHRDFKPANVLLAADGPRVIDFGTARSADDSLSVTSQTVGTPAYMAPEHLSGDQVGPAADMFAWATTIVFAATGRVAVSFLLGHRGDVALGSEVPVGGVVRQVQLRVGALASFGIGDVDAVVSHTTAQTLGMPLGNALIISAPSTRLNLLNALLTQYVLPGGTRSRVLNTKKGYATWPALPSSSP